MKLTINELAHHNRKELGNNINLTLFRVLRHNTLNECLGRGGNAIIYRAGKELGIELQLKTVEEVVKFCRDTGIGIISITNENPLRIRCEECIVCSGFPKMGKKLCYFEGGFVAGCLENILKRPVDVEEIACAGLGDDYCEFEVIERESK